MSDLEVKAALSFSDVIWNKKGSDFPVTASLDSKTGEVTTRGYPSQYYPRLEPIPLERFAREFEVKRVGSWDAAVEAVKAKLIHDATLRDHFAGLAMQGLISKCGNQDAEFISRNAYHIADAMLKARGE